MVTNKLIKFHNLHGVRDSNIFFFLKIKTKDLIRHDSDKKRERDE